MSWRFGGNGACGRTLDCAAAVNRTRREMIVYPLDFHRRAEQKWARRLKSVRTLVAHGGNRVCAPDALAVRMAHRARGQRNRPAFGRA
jgi:hypothetical protein